MPFSIINLIIGFSLDRLMLSDKSKKICSIVAICIFLLPIGLVLRGLTYPSMALAPIAMMGSIAFIVTSVYLIVGTVKSE
jgi:hypothetical protein